MMSGWGFKTRNREANWGTGKRNGRLITMKRGSTAHGGQLTLNFVDIFYNMTLKIREGKEQVPVSQTPKSQSEKKEENKERHLPITPLSQPKDPRLGNPDYPEPLGPRAPLGLSPQQGWKLLMKTQQDRQTCSRCTRPSRSVSTCCSNNCLNCSSSCPAATLSPAS